MFSVASVQLAITHFGTRETLGCSRVDKSQKVKLRHSRGNSTRSGETPPTIVKPEWVVNYALVKQGPKMQESASTKMTHD